MKSILLTLFLLLVGCSAPNFRTYTPEEQGSTVVTVLTKCGTGSGVVISKTSILTALHVVSGCPGPYMVQDTQGNMYLVAIDVASAQSDLVRLSINTGPDDLFPDEFSTAQDKMPKVARPGAYVCVETRHPDTERKCGWTTNIAEEGWKFSYNIKIVPGNSGSAIWDLSGNLVGIVGCYNSITGFGCGTILAPREWIIYGS